MAFGKKISASLSKTSHLFLCTCTSIFLVFSFFLSSQAAENKAEISKRNYISIVGSSTVYPFTASVAERFGRDKKFRTPTVEANGTGGGFKLFCGGIGYSFPDFSNASRKIEPSEIKNCNENGIKQIGEIKIGYDGIVIANAISGKKMNLTKQQLFLALAEKIPHNGKLVENPYKKWKDIDPSLPNIAIRIYGPPSSSGTRDAFAELVLEHACINLPEFISEFSDKKIRGKKCRVIRSDGFFIEAGENDNLILQKLKNDKEALGIFGFSFLEENKNSIQASRIDGIEPSFASIISNKYSVSRPLFIYFKKEHFELVPGMKQFIQAIISKDTIGLDGYLVQKGLIPLSNSELKKTRDEVLQGL